MRSSAKKVLLSPSKAALDHAFKHFGADVETEVTGRQQDLLGAIRVTHSGNARPTARAAAGKRQLLAPVVENGFLKLLHRFHAAVTEV